MNVEEIFKEFKTRYPQAAKICTRFESGSKASEILVHTVYNVIFVYDYTEKRTLVKSSV
jgi:hypothetical protein